MANPSHLHTSPGGISLSLSLLWAGPSPKLRFLSPFQPPQPDYLAINYYQGLYAYYDAKAKRDKSTPKGPDGNTLPTADSRWLQVFPASLRAMLRWVDRRYGRVPIVITENGVDVPGEQGGVCGAVGG